MGLCCSTADARNCAANRGACARRSPARAQLLAARADRRRFQAGQFGLDVCIGGSTHAQDREGDASGIFNTVFDARRYAYRIDGFDNERQGAQRHAALAARYVIQLLARVVAMRVGFLSPMNGGFGQTLRCDAVGRGMHHGVHSSRISEPSRVM